MAVSCQVIRFQKDSSGTTNATQDVTLNFTPKAIILTSDGSTTDDTFTDHSQFIQGFSDGTNHACITILGRDASTVGETAGIHRNDSVFVRLQETATTTELARATCSFATNKVTFTWTVNNTDATYITLFAVGGTDITNAKVNTVTTGTNATGTVDYTGLGFTVTGPTGILFTMAGGETTANSATSAGSSSYGAAVSSTQRFCVSNTYENTGGTTDSWRFGTSDRCLVAQVQSSGAIDYYANFSAWITDGFRLNYENAPSGTTQLFSYLVIKGGIWDVGLADSLASVGSETTTVTASSNTIRGMGTATTGLDFVANTTTAAHGYMAIGFSDGTTEGWVNSAYRDANTTSQTARRNSATNRVLAYNGPVTATASSTPFIVDADFSSFGTNQFTLSYSAVGITPTDFGWFIVADQTPSLTPVTKTVTAPLYDIRQEFTDTNTLRYNLNQLLTDTNTLLYNVLQSVTDTNTLRYNILQLVEDTTTLLYKIDAAITKTSTLRYDLIAQTIKTATFLYDIITVLSVTKTVNILHNILQSLTDTNTLRYNLNTLVTDTNTLRYNVLAAVSDITTLRFDLLQSVLDTNTLKYNITVPVTDTNTIRYNVTAEMTKTNTLVYNILMSIALPKAVSLIYDIVTQTTKSNTIRYNLDTDITKIFNMLYNITTAVTPKSLSLLYDLLQTVTDTNTIIYNIETQAIPLKLIKKNTASTDLSDTMRFEETTGTDTTVSRAFAKNEVYTYQWATEPSLDINTLDWQGGDWTWRFRVTTATAANITEVVLQRISNDGATMRASKSTGAISISTNTTGVKSGTISWNDGTQNPAGRQTTDRVRILITVTKNNAVGTLGVGTNLETNNDEITNPILKTVIQLIAVTKPLTLKYDLLSQPVKQLSIRYDVIAQIAKSYSLIYNVSAEMLTAKAVNLLYNISQEASSSTSLVYNLLQEITKTCNLLFEMLQEFTDTNTLRYDVTQKVEEAKTLIFNILEEVTKSGSLLYNLDIEMIAKQVSLLYNILQPVVDVNTFIYDIITTLSVTTALSIIYNVDKELIKTGTLRYDIEAIGEVIKSMSLIHDINGRIDKQIISKFNIDIPTLKSQTLRFDVSVAISKQYSILYNLYSKVVKQNTLRFDVNTAISKMLSILYEVIQETEKIETLRYNLDSEVVKELSSLFDITNVITKTNNLVYNILQSASETTSLKYDMIGRTVNTTRLLYDIYSTEMIVVKTLNLLHNIDVTMTKSSSIKYEVNQDMSKLLRVAYGIQELLTKSSNIIYSILPVTQVTPKEALHERLLDYIFSQYNIPDPPRSEILWHEWYNGQADITIDSIFLTSSTIRQRSNVIYKERVYRCALHIFYRVAGDPGSNANNPEEYNNVINHLSNILTKARYNLYYDLGYNVHECRVINAKEIPDQYNPENTSPGGKIRHYRFLIDLYYQKLIT